MILSATFMLNLLCAIVPCDPQFRQPEIAAVSAAENELGNRIDKRYLDAGLEQEDDPFVVTNNGAVEGYVMQSSGGHKFYAFQGIPYAEPPVGNLRFRSPVRAKPWKGVLRANHPAPDCLQQSPSKMFRVYGNEDCLFLNVYTAKLPSKSRYSKLPVVVWIHGGSFFYGSGAEYGPSYLMDEKIVLVTFNYRLGVLGFISTGDEAAPGNFGLKDQATAIQWVHENIDKFGGDPNQVTLLGHSAGGASVHLHLISNTTRPYFKSAVSMSGTAFNRFGFKTNKKIIKYTTEVARKFRCINSRQPFQFQTEQIINCLRRRDPVKLVDFQRLLPTWGPFPITYFAPTLESANSSDAFITKTPKEAYATGDVAKVPWISTITEDEGLYPLLIAYGLFMIPRLKEDFKVLAPTIFEYGNVDYITSRQITKQILNFYFKNKDTRDLSITELSKPISDRLFVNEFHDAIKAHSKVASTYSYVFRFKGKYNVADFMNINADEWGVGHAEDVFYLFNSSGLYHGFKADDPERQISHLLVNLITNFAKTGVPTYTAQGYVQSVWDPVDARDLQLLQIDKQVKMIADPFLQRVQFWKDLGI